MTNDDKKDDRKADAAGSVPLGANVPAPDFTLHSTPDQSVSLKDFRGRPAILAFYPADWSPVCGDQLAVYNELREEFHRYDAELLAISADGILTALENLSVDGSPK